MTENILNYYHSMLGNEQLLDFRTLSDATCRVTGENVPALYTTLFPEHSVSLVCIGFCTYLNQCNSVESLSFSPFCPS